MLNETGVEDVCVLCHSATQCQIQAAMLQESQIPQEMLFIVHCMAFS